MRSPDRVVPLTSARGRLAREIEHHRRIADQAEIIWNWDSPSGRRRADRRASIFVECCGLAPGRRVLEIGCGTGIFLEKVAPSGARLVGLDLSEDLLAKARARLAGAPNDVLHRGNAEHLPYADASFDAVYGSSVLHHLDLDRALGEVLRVLRPGGRCAFTEPNIVNPQVALMFRLGLTKKYFGVSPDEMAFSRFRAMGALREAGFAEPLVRPFDFLHPATPEALCDAVDRLGRGIERVPLLREITGSFVVSGRRP
jgi:ubiquinone/menaquinone biosynthesis C-methylase UbiE